MEIIFTLPDVAFEEIIKDSLRQKKQEYQKVMLENRIPRFEVKRKE